MENVILPPKDLNDLYLFSLDDLSKFIEQQYQIYNNTTDPGMIIRSKQLYQTAVYTYHTRVGRVVFNKEP